MSMPKVPDITPEFELERDEAITLLLTSIAMEEMGLAHILNAEGEKVQYLLGQKNKGKLGAEQLLEINGSVEAIIRSVTKLQIILSDKLDNVIRLLQYERHKGEKPPCPEAACALAGSGVGCVASERDCFSGATVSLEAFDEKMGRHLWKYTLYKQSYEGMILVSLTPLHKNLKVSCSMGEKCPTPEKPNTMATCGRALMLCKGSSGVNRRATVDFSLQVWDYGIGAKFQMKTWYRGEQSFEHDSGVVRVTQGDLRIKERHSGTQKC